jgi:stage V sporulation protein G
MSEFLPVTFEVIGIEPVRGSDRLVALAIVDIEVAGVAIQIQGVQVVRDARGQLSVRSPMFRCAAGRWRSAILLPDTLREALGAEVLAAVHEQGLAA